jgi:hypothetical protein
MLAGPILIVACPHCGRLAQIRTLASGKTAAARSWTDGKVMLPTLPPPPEIT